MFKGPISFLAFFLFNLEVYAVDKWEWQNPLPQGNGLHSVFFLSEKIGYAVGEAGTVIKTIDGGGSWSFQSLPFRSPTDPRKNLYSISFASEDTGFIVGEDAACYKTTDAGKNWEERYFSNGTLRQIFFSDAKNGYAIGENSTFFHTKDGGYTFRYRGNFDENINENYSSCSFPRISTGYVSGDTGNIYKSLDSGTTWKKINITKLRPNKLDQLKFLFFGSPDTGFALGGNVVFKTVDGGIHWEPIYVDSSYADFVSGYFKNNDTGFVFNNQNDLFRTTNGGKSWLLKTSGIPSGLYLNLFNSLVFFGATGYIVCGRGLILKTNDYGENWSIISNYPYEKHITSMSFPTQKIGYMITENTLFNTKNGGVSWLPISTDTAKHFHRIQFVDSITGYSGGGNRHFLMKTSDGGRNWAPQIVPTVDVTVTSMSFLGPKIGYVFSQAWKMYKSINGGSTWDSAATPGSFVNCNFVNDTLGYAIGSTVPSTSNYNCLKTINGGKQWDTVFRALPSGSNVYFYNENNGFVFGGGKIFKSINAGRTWFEVFSSNLFPVDPTRYLTDMKFVNPSVGYCVGKKEVLITNNGGNSWTRQSTGSTAGFTHIEFADTLVGFAYGTDDGNLMKLTRGGSSGISKKQLVASNFGVGPNGTFLIELPRASRVTVNLLDIKGKVVRKLFNGSQTVGKFAMELPKDAIAQGAYILDIKTDSFRKAIMLKRN